MERPYVTFTGVYMVERSRSRSDADNWGYLPHGTVASGYRALQQGNFTNPHCYFANLNSSVLEAQLFVLDDLEIPLSGCVSTTQSGGYWLYDLAKLTTRFNAYASELLAVALARGYGAAVPISTRKLCVMSGGSTMTDVSTLNFKGLSAKGGIIMSPMSQSKSLKSSSVKLKNTSQGYTVSNIVVSWSGAALATRRLTLNFRVNWVGHGYAALGVTESVIDTFMTANNINITDQLPHQAAVNDAFARVYEAELDIPVILAEMNKSVSMVRNSLQSLTKMLVAIKKLMKGQVSSSSKDLADIWLQYRYGWLPLIGDLRTAITMLSDGSQKTPRRTFRGYDEDEDTNSLDYTVSADGYNHRFVGIHTIKRTVRAGVLTQIDTGLGNLRDLGLLNPPGTIWELVPYSFVVDWFVNVSGLLASLNPSAILESKGSWATCTVTETFSGTVTVTHSTLSLTEVLPFAGQWERRVRLVDVGQTFINVDLDINPTRILDAISLLLKARH
nr:MAG: hypothetical protein 1 [Leviviridae sp.]